MIEQRRGGILHLPFAFAAGREDCARERDDGGKAEPLGHGFRQRGAVAQLKIGLQHGHRAGAASDEYDLRRVYFQLFCMVEQIFDRCEQVFGRCLQSIVQILCKGEYAVALDTFESETVVGRHRHETGVGHPAAEFRDIFLPLVVVYEAAAVDKHRTGMLCACVGRQIEVHREGAGVPLHEWLLAVPCRWFHCLELLRLGLAARGQVLFHYLSVCHTESGKQHYCNQYLFHNSSKGLRGSTPIPGLSFSVILPSVRRIPQKQSFASRILPSRSAQRATGLS